MNRLDKILGNILDKGQSYYFFSKTALFSIIKKMHVQSRVVCSYNKVKAYWIFYLIAILLSCSNTKAQFARNDTILFASDITRSHSLIDDHDNIAGNNYKNDSFLLNILNRATFSGDWWNVRNILNETGLNFDIVYKGEVFSNVSGGYQKGATSLDNIDLVLSADLDKSFGFANTNLTIQFLGNSGGSPCDLAGASQGISNIETVPAWKLYQLLFEKIFFDEQFSFMVGLYDLNSEFDTRETSSIFINPSHGIGPDFSQSGLNGPSIFPTTSAAVRLKYESGNGNYFQTAVLDGVPGDMENPYGTHVIFDKEDGLLLTAEIGFIKNEGEQLNSKIAFGAWTYTSNFEKNNFLNGEIISTSVEKNYGFYFSAEKLLGSNFGNPDKNLFGFLRIGIANKNINPVDFYLGAGLKITGLINNRSEDEFGLALAFEHNSLMFRKNLEMLEDIFIKPYELNLEATYTLQLTPWLTLQPDIQYIINPSYCTVSESAFVMGSRIQLIF